MRFVKIFLLVLFVFVTTQIFGWGDEGHKLIAEFGIRMLPRQMKLPDDLAAAIVEHSVDPDHRKREDKSEGAKHFIDIDYYKEFLDGHMIMSRDSLEKIYDESTVAKQGVLPWATEDTYKNLVEAFKQNDRDNILLYASDLAHYVGDGHQPMHETINYNGQLTDQKGVHSRYESEMVNANLSKLKSSFKKQTPYYIKDISSYVFDYIYESNSYLEVLLSADKSSSEITGGSYNKDYYRLMWFKTKYVTEYEFNSAALSLASLIYSAWKDAGKPILEK
jgi:hypothetical protein